MEQLTATTPSEHNLFETAAVKEDIPIEERNDVTVDELERGWESLPYPAELDNGKVVFKMPNLEHGMIHSNVDWALRSYLKKHPIGYIALETNFRLWDDRPHASFIPDICFIAKERIPKNKRRFPDMAPDLAVEIVSEDDSHNKIMAKVKAYLQQGTKVVWVIFASTREVLVCTTAGKHYVGIDEVLTAPDVLPDFALPVREIFWGLEE
ncbi:MAG: Uma2 family endonuclease [candidate division KSB1 bacterium]|nr:Uma2 family endonuclease [candidate division KSB1 bacterium]MDZ7368985.1 Uma2 family endonuclease [candidate division KSB1 bacterium]MDZ7406977.1 Uma2 family endonuclease [candidate division KSB1 bacterium]